MTRAADAPLVRPSAPGSGPRAAAPQVARRLTGPVTATGALRLAGTALVVAGLLSGCSGGAGAGSTSPSPSPTATAPPAPAPAPVALTSGSLTLTLQPEAGFVAAGGQVTVAGDEDGSARATVVRESASIVPVGVLSAPAGATLSMEADTSVSVLGADGTWLGGLVVSGVGAGLVGLSDGTVRFSAAGGASLWLATKAVESLDWGTREGGRSLAVTPTPWARSGALAAEAGVWAAMSADPDAAVPTMRAQLDCHLLGARDKATWNLEPWRPDVDTATMIATSCNPR